MHSLILKDAANLGETQPSQFESENLSNPHLMFRKPPGMQPGERDRGGRTLTRTWNVVS